jgi:putative ABC transport system permease protein
VLLAVAGVTLLLASAGLFGVLSYGVAQRVREIGVRAALGARPFEIVALVARQGVGIALVGLTIGLAAAFALGSTLTKLLYGISPRDPTTFGAVAAIVLLVTVVACVGPARRATRIDPVRALKAG